MKTLAFALCLLAVCSCSFLGNKYDFQGFSDDERDARDDLQEIFAGFWEEGGLPEPVDEIKCFDVPTAELTMEFIGDFLRSVAMNDVISLTIALKNFNKNFPPETLRCMGNLSETDDVKEAYGVLEIPYPILKMKFAEYVVRHIAELGEHANKAYFFYFQGQYKELGGYFGKVVKEVVKMNYTQIKLEELYQILKEMNL